METKYPIGIQNFEKLRRDGCVYVDKTDLIYRLISNGFYYFLSRPRRFGKSLLLSTIEAYFEGKRELFRGLAIDTLTEEWEPRPVLHLDLNTANLANTEALNRHLKYHLDVWDKKYDINSSTDGNLADRFQTIIRSIREKTGRKVVILIDEYDKPLLMSVHDPDLEDRMRDILKSFYGVLKSRDGGIKFGMMTGVTKFGKISIFSDLNNLNDITLDERFDTLCGITPAELTTYFSQGIKEMSDKNGVDTHVCLEMLRKTYDGYHFSKALRDVYNPFSLLNALDKGEISSYWFETGTPTFLAHMIRRTHISLPNLDHENVGKSRMMTADLISNDIVPVMFQSGYLTIKEYDREFDEYLLSYPNLEVKQGFLRYLLPYFTPDYNSESAFDIKKFVREIRNGEPEAFMKRFSSLFAGFPYDQVGDCERHYHNVVYLTMTLLGFYVRSEYKTSDGRCDAVVMTDRFIYIFEFKYDKSAREALDQIIRKHYDAPFAADSRKVFRIGVNFSSETRTIDDYIIQ
ncbi:MAG: ATP-binding protein [Muribaculaceae bacterium]|nr:ATP-binding protein [Muribaculaceae bacterium]